MARSIDPTIDDGTGGGGGDPGGPGYVPPTAPGAKLAVVVTGSSVTFASDQITAAGGPWPAFKIRVTPLNDSGSGTAAEVTYPS